MDHIRLVIRYEGVYYRNDIETIPWMKTRTGEYITEEELDQAISFWIQEKYTHDQLENWSTYFTR